MKTIEQNLAAEDKREDIHEILPGQITFAEWERQEEGRTNEETEK